GRQGVVESLPAHEAWRRASRVVYIWHRGTRRLTPRGFLLSDATPLIAAVRPSTPTTGKLRQNILETMEFPRVDLHRSGVFTGVVPATQDKPWELRKAMALREHASSSLFHTGRQ
ncbi:MAG TPA: hypothetical protein DEH78_13015, partial [Solibacterales bacterium]|nr:hypothetical protein [Bryobacterales bacterium]